MTGNLDAVRDPENSFHCFSFNGMRDRLEIGQHDDTKTERTHSESPKNIFVRLNSLYTP